MSKLVRKKALIAISVVASFATSSFAVSNSELLQKIDKLEKEVTTLKGKVSHVNMLANHDNLKLSVDFRSSVDGITYTLADGSEAKNSSLLTNRLWIKGAYAPSSNLAFYTTLSFNKAFGDSANHAQSNTNPGYANFDWVTNENALDDTLKVKEAYWLYKNDSFLGTNMSWTASIGRRPSTDGLGINFREDQKRKSALAHTVNVEFDGASFRWNLGDVTPMEGSWFKLCMGRGLTNAKPRFTMDGTDYSEDKTLNPDVDMYGFIFVPYDDGQYSIHTNYAKATHMIGFDGADMQTWQGAYMTWKANPTAANFADMMYKSPQFKDQGDLDLATVMFKADGIGDGINDFLDDTKFFISYAQSKTHPKTGHAMLGSTKSETGHSTWIGLQMPCPISEDGRWGVEWNKGSKYWRSVTYGEDTFVGSKIAARGKAWEFYYTKPLTKALSFSFSYTDIKYDYTGSNSFFGADGTPMTISQAQAMGLNPVKEAKDVRAYIRYRY